MRDVTGRDAYPGANTTPQNFDPTQKQGELTAAEVNACKLKGSTIAQEAIRKLSRHLNNVAAIQCATEILQFAKSLPSGGVARDDDSGRYETASGGIFNE